MNARRQNGLTLLETAVAAGLIAIALGGALYALAAFGKYAAQQGGPGRTAALIAARQTLRVAQDAWKYGSPGSTPSGSQSITLPLSAQTSAPATVTTIVSSGVTPAQMTVTVQYTPEPGRSGDPGVVSVRGQVAAKAPLPGSRVDKPGLIALPSGAP